MGNRFRVTSCALHMVTLFPEGPQKDSNEAQQRHQEGPGLSVPTDFPGKCEPGPQFGHKKRVPGHPRITGIWERSVIQPPPSPGRKDSLWPASEALLGQTGTS